MNEKLNSQGFLKKLFLEEEFRGDKTINSLRFYLALVLLLLTLIKGGLFHKLIISPSLIVTLILIGFALLYTGVLFFLYKKNIYHPAFKFISMSFDITLIVGSIYAYKLDSYQDYATILFLARLAIIYIFIFLSILRYSFMLSLYAGVLAGIEYLLLVVFGNEFVGKTFTFVGKEYAVYTSSFVSAEVYLRIVYFLLSGVTAGLIANNLKKLVINSLRQQQRKNELETQNKINEAITAEYQKLTNNINDALLLIDKDFMISPLFSKRAVEIFETDNIADKNFLDLIYADSTSKEEREELSHFLSILWKNTVTEMDMLNDINPLREKEIIINGHKKIITVSFGKIYENKKMTNVMLTIQDITELKQAEQQLQEAQEKHETELENISAILNVDTSSFHDFLEEAYRALNFTKENLANLDDEDVINQAFRYMHSLKGTSHTMGFLGIAKKSHQLEDMFASVRDDPQSLDADRKKEIRALIEELILRIDDIAAMSERFSSFKKSSSSDISYIENFKNELKTMVLSLSEKLEKPADIDIDITIENPSFLKKIKNSVIHLLRNAVDHGIEDKYERLSASKSEKAKILVSVRKKGKFYIVEIYDDGKGISFDKVQQKAAEKNLLKNSNPSRADLLNVLFMPGFSSKDAVSEISGRGVGLDVVKEAVDALKGKILIATEKNKGTKFIIKIPAAEAENG